MEQKNSHEIVTFTEILGPSFNPTLRPEEPDLQDLYENNNFYKALDPNDFDREAWWYRCRICGGQTRLRTKHIYCKHCGFSNHK